MTIQITKSIPLPVRLQKVWKGRRVFFSADNDTLILKRVQTTSPNILRQQLRKAGKRISRKMLKDAIWNAHS